MKRFLNRIRALPRVAATSIGAVLVVIVLVYYPIGMIIVHHIDDSPEYSAEAHEVEGGSAAVSMAVALIERETKKHHWSPSDPFFYPGWMLVRMPAFQRGIKDSVARFTIEMYDHLGRTRGSSQADPDLQKAMGLLNYSPYVWLFDLSTSWLPTTSSTKQLQAGARALADYNVRLSTHQAVYERRADNLIEVLGRIASDLGASSAALSQHIDTRSGLALRDAGDLFYHTKGSMYGNYLLLKALGRDYAEVLREKEMQNAWELMLDSLRDGMELSDFLVLNSRPDSQFFPNHLAAQGFYVIRARTQILEISNILLK